MLASDELRLREHEEREVEISPQDASSIAGLAGQVDVRPSSVPGRYLVKASSYAGIVVLPSDRVLIIEPKVPIETLFALLDAVYDPDMRIFREIPAGYLTIEDLFEFIIAHFIDLTEDLVKHGAIRGYETVIEASPTLRGKLLLPQTLRTLSTLRGEHWVRYSQFTPDIPENQILRWTTFVLEGYRFRDVSSFGRLRRLDRLLAAVSLIETALDLFDDLTYHRLNEHYRPALALAQLILRHLTFSGRHGATPFLSFLIDMNALFERYVGHVLRSVTSHVPSRLRSQPVYKLDAAREINLRPDFVLYTDQGPLLVLDAKYKLSAAQSDVYQMVSYCHGLGTDTAVLIHPASESAPGGLVRILGPGAFTVHYLALTLSGGSTELADHAQSLVDQLLPLIPASTPHLHT